MKSKTEQYTLRLQYTAEASKFYRRNQVSFVLCARCAPHEQFQDEDDYGAITNNHGLINITLSKASHKPCFCTPKFATMILLREIVR